MKLSKKQWIGTILVAIILLAVVLGIVYTKTDLLKTPRDLFYKYLVGNVESFGKVDYDKILEEVKSSKEKRSTITGSIGIQVEGKNAEQAEKEMYDAIGNVKVNYEGRNIPQEKKALGTVTVQYKNKDFLKMDLAQDQDIYGIRMEELLDKYITVENKDIKKLAEKLEIDTENLPDRLEVIDPYDLLYVSKADRTTIINTYKEILNEQLKEEKFKKEKNVEIVVNENNIKANAYTLSLTEKERNILKIKLLEKLKIDDLTLGIIVEKANKMNIGQTLSEEGKITKENLVKEIEKYIDDIKDRNEEIDRSKDEKTEENLDVTVYEYKGKTIKTNIKSGESVTDIEVYSTKDQAKAVINIKEDIDIDDNVVISIDTKKEKDVTNTKINVKETQYDEKTEMTFETKKTKKEEGIYDITGIVTLTNEEYQVNLTINETIDHKREVSIENLNDKNSFNLNKEEKEKIQSMVQEVSKSLEKILPEKLKTLGLDEETITNLFSSTTTNSSNINDEEFQKEYMKIYNEYENGIITQEEAETKANELFEKYYGMDTNLENNDEENSNNDEMQE